jgi:hypothetical protein
MDVLLRLRSLGEFLELQRTPRPVPPPTSDVNIEFAERQRHRIFTNVPRPIASYCKKQKSKGKEVVNAEKAGVAYAEPTNMPSAAPKSSSDQSKVHKLQIKGSAKVGNSNECLYKSSYTDVYVQLVTEFFEYGINTILFQRGVYPPEDFSACVSSSIHIRV